MLVTDLKNGQNERREIFKRDLAVKAKLIIDAYIHGLLLMPNN